MEATENIEEGFGGTMKGLYTSEKDFCHVVLDGQGMSFHGNTTSFIQSLRLQDRQDVRE